MEACTRRLHGANLVEFWVNERGHEFLEEKQYAKVIEVFRLNVLAFPGSFNAYDSLGEAYLSAGMIELAIDSYRRSVVPKSGERECH